MRIKLLGILFCGILLLGVSGCKDKINKNVTLSLKEGTLTNKGVTLILKNNSKINYSYGEPYYIEQEKELELNYNDGYIIEPDTAYVNIGDNFDNWIYVAGTSINTKRLEVDPLEETTYILRGAFEVSEKVETETENSLKLKLPFDLEYTIR